VSTTRARWDAELALDTGARLGEGPVWSPDEGLLYWVDIDLGRVHRFDPVQGLDEDVDVGEPVGAVVPRRGGGLVLALQSGFALADEWRGPLRRLATVEVDLADNRMNDGACDTSGRFWAGTMCTAGRPERGSLYRLDPDGEVTQMLRGVTISNGIGWSPDDTTMYHVDTPTGGIDAFAFDSGSGTIASRRRLIDVEPGDGQPDGLVVDRDGCIWVALWDGWAVRRYAPDGTLLGVIDVPVGRVTKCAFAGPSLDDLYITTASPDADDPDQPHAGALFHVRPGVAGLPATPFAG
jgi:sugar lactone lactonase YvrE